MPIKPSRLFFDKNDYELLRIVNEVLARGSKTGDALSPERAHASPRHQGNGGPQGIAYRLRHRRSARVVRTGKPLDRIKALRSLRDEVFLSSTTFYQKNTARVLVQIMKDLLRCQDNELRQLKLAHDFRMVSTGNPRLVRAELARYHLLEMPEEWNQFAFDDHVHDANTKGRKSPTHLVMDAWIKGIRHLTVVYYNYVGPEVVEELVEASAILGSRSGSVSRCRRASATSISGSPGSPTAFTTTGPSSNFSGGDAVKEMMDEGRHVSHYQQRYIFEVLAVFNSSHRQALANDFSLQLGPLDRAGFVNSVGTGQPSLLHLASYIHSHLQPQITEEVERMRAGICRRLRREAKRARSPPQPAEFHHPRAAHQPLSRALPQSGHPRPECTAGQRPDVPPCSAAHRRNCWTGSRPCIPVRSSPSASATCPSRTPWSCSTTATA